MTQFPLTRMALLKCVRLRHPFGLNGFRIGAKIDKRPFPPIVGPYVINRTGIFRGLVVELESTPEFSSMVDIAVADMRRKGLSAKLA